MLIRFTAAAMMAAFLTMSVPTTSHAGSYQCKKLVSDMQRTLENRKASGTLSRLEDILEEMEEQCDISTFLNAASKVGKLDGLLDRLKD